MSEDGSVKISVSMSTVGVSTGVQKINSAISGISCSGLEDLQTETDEAAEKAEKAGRKINDSFANVGQKMTTAGAVMSASITAPLVAIGTSAFNTAAEFDNVMASMQAMTGTGAEEMETLRQYAIQMGADTIYSAKDAADAMLELSKAGISNADILGGVLEATLKLATTGDLELANASTIVTNAMHQFRLAASDTESVVTDLAGVANASTSSVASLGEGLGNCGNVASQVGWDMQQTTAVLGLFSDRGIDGAEAGTQLRSMLLKLMNPADETKEIIEQLGIEIRDSNGNIKDAAGLAQELQTKLGGLDKATQDYALSQMFGSYAIQGASALMQGGAEAVQQYTTAAYDAQSTQDLFNAQMSGSKGAMEQLSGSLETASLVIGEALAPTVVDVAGKIQELIDWFTNLDEGTQQTIVKFGALAAAAGPVTIALGVFCSSVSKIISTSSSLISGLGSIGTKLAGLAGKTSTAGGAFTKLTSVMSGAKLGLIGIGTAIAGIAIGAICAQIAEAEQRTKDFNAATMSLSDLQGVANGAISAANTSLDNQQNLLATGAQSVQDSTNNLQSLCSQIKKTNQTFLDNMSGVQSNIGQVDTYKKTINELANKNLPLTAVEQTKLKNAVEQYNAITGDSIQVTDEVKGSLSKSTDEINANTEAWKRNALAQVYKELATNSIKDIVDTQSQLEESYKTLESAQKALNDWTPTYNADGTADWAFGAQLEQNVKQAEENISKLNEALTANQNKYDSAINSATLMTRSVKDISQAFKDAGLGANAFSALAQSMGTDTDSLTTKLNSAGIATEKLTQVGTATFKAMYDSVGGNMTQLKLKLDSINTVTIGDKHFTVTDDGTIYNEEGQIAQLQQLTIDGKHYYVTNDGHVYNEQGQLQGLNNVHINGKHYSVSNDGTAWTAKCETEDVTNAVNNIPNSANTTITADTTQAKSALEQFVDWLKNVGKFFGDIFGRLNLNGGSLGFGASTSLNVPQFAHGGIVSKPTFGVFGEAGTEANIPLQGTNKMKPFAQAVAGYMPAQNSEIDYAMMAAAIAAALQNVSVNIDSKQVANLTANANDLALGARARYAKRGVAI